MRIVEANAAKRRMSQQANLPPRLVKLKTESVKIKAVGSKAMDLSIQKKENSATVVKRRKSSSLDNYSTVNEKKESSKGRRNGSENKEDGGDEQYHIEFSSKKKSEKNEYKFRREDFKIE